MAMMQQDMERHEMEDWDGESWSGGHEVEDWGGESWSESDFPARLPSGRGSPLPSIFVFLGSPGRLSTPGGGWVLGAGNVTGRDFLTSSFIFP